MNAFERKRRSTTVWVTIALILVYLPIFFRWTIVILMGATAWVLWRFVLRYFLSGSFRCAKCRHMKCKKHTGLVISPETIVCKNCTTEAVELAERVDKVHKIADSISDAFKEHEFPIKYSPPEEPEEK